MECFNSIIFHVQENQAIGMEEKKNIYKEG